MIKEVMLYFGDIELFLQENEDLGPHLQSKLLAFFDDPQFTSKLRVEIAATVDWGEPFAGIQGDGLLSFNKETLLLLLRIFLMF